ncbi:MAG: toxin-antitoxin system HicB family antitoxin [Prosthecobacter sp.]
MTTVSIPIPDSILHGIQELAAKDGYTLESFMASAAAEKLSVFQGVDYLKKRAAKADLADFDRLLERVPDVEPDANDRLD